MSNIDVSRGEYDSIPIMEDDQVIKMTLCRVIVMVTVINMNEPSAIFSIRFVKFDELNNQVGMCKELCG